jgi:hypothetical protein
MSELQPHTIDHIFGLRRSGHHAVINWLKSCYEAVGETVHHENSVYNRHLSNAISWNDATPEMVWQKAQGSDALLVSYEDVDIEQREDSPVYSGLQLPEHGYVVRDTIVLRDWYNLAASRLMLQAKNRSIGKHDGLIFGVDWRDIETRWLKYAGLAIQGGPDSAKFIGINYNYWFMSPTYKNELARKYGLSNCSSSVDEVPDFASGSSFDGRAKNGSGRAMNVLKRWQDLPPDLLPHYIRLISNPGLHKINKRLFDIDGPEVIESVRDRLAA